MFNKYIYKLLEYCENMPNRSPRSSINIIKIIKTTNLTEELSQEIISKLKSEEIFKTRENKKCGFYEEFIFSKKNSCDLDFLLINEEYKNILKDPKFDEDNINHVKLYKANYVLETNGEYDQFIDIFFIPKLDLIITTGSKNEGKTAIKLLKKILNKYKEDKLKKFDFNEINFSPNFLLWLVYKKSIKEDLSSNLTIDRFYDFATKEFIGEDGLTPSSIPNSISTVDMDNLISLPIIYGILNDRDFSKLSGKFSYKNNNFEITIDVLPDSKNSLIFIKTRFCLNNKHYCDKIRYSFPFINEIVNIYTEWENFEPIKQYPSEKFINKLKVKLIKEFNLTFNKYYDYKKDFNEKTKRKPDKSGKIISINPEIDLSNVDEKIDKYIEYLVSENVLLYLQD